VADTVAVYSWQISRQLDSSHASAQLVTTGDNLTPAAIDTVMQPQSADVNFVVHAQQAACSCMIVHRQVQPQPPVVRQHQLFFKGCVTNTSPTRVQGSLHNDVIQTLKSIDFRQICLLVHAANMACTTTNSFAGAV
jgi:hypothetical protein